MRMMLPHQVLQVNHKYDDDNDADDEKTEEIILLPLSINSQYKRFCKVKHTQKAFKAFMLTYPVV